MTEVRLKGIDKPLGMEVAFLSLLVPAVLAKTASGICEEKKWPLLESLALSPTEH